MKILIAIPLCVLLGACATVTGQGSVPVTRIDNSALQTLSWTAMQCTYTMAKANGATNISEPDVRRAIPDCDVQISAYINVLARRVQNDNGWSSLHPSVKPTLRQQYEDRLVTEIARAQ